MLHPSVHRKHHETFDCNFCIFNGWANGLLNLLVPSIFGVMRTLPNHFDSAAIPPPRDKSI